MSSGSPAAASEPPAPPAPPAAEGYSVALVELLRDLLRCSEGSRKAVLGLPDAERIIPRLMAHPLLPALKASAGSSMRTLWNRLEIMSLDVAGRVLLHGLPLVPADLHALAVALASIRVYTSGREMRGSVNCELVTDLLKERCAAGWEGVGGPSAPSSLRTSSAC